MFLGRENYEKLHIKSMDKYLDFWNLMAYDYAGSWDSTCGHQSNLYPSISNPSSTPFSTCTAVSYYKEHGVSGPKLVIGMPLYGRAFASTDGPGTTFCGTGAGSWEQGVWDFKCLPQQGALEMYCDEACASWSYDPDKRLMISYDTAEIAKRKANFIKENGLGGAMWWETSGDKEGEGSLIHTVGFLCFHDVKLSEPGAKVVRCFGIIDASRNTLSYPDSRYDNLRNGFPNE
jgi:chitinase